MKKLILLYLISLIFNYSQAQTAGQLVSINKFNDFAEISAINNPNDGSLAYNLNNGFMYYYNGSSWIPLTLGGVNWSVSGNSVTTSNFLGTINNQNLDFQSNNVDAWTLSTNGNLVPTRDYAPTYANYSPNTIIGQNSLQNIDDTDIFTTSINCVAIGNNVIENNGTHPAQATIAIGKSALNNRGGFANVCIGKNSSSPPTNTNNHAQNVQIGFSSSGDGIRSFAFGTNSSFITSDVGHVGSTGVISIGGPVNWAPTSDARFKENLKDNVIGIDFIMGLKPLTYNFNTKKLDLFQRDSTIHSREHYQKLYDISRIGFLAQEVEALSDSLGFDFHGVYRPQSDKDIYGLRYSEFIAPIVKAIQEQQIILEQQIATIEQQNKKIEAQKQSLKKLYNRTNEIIH